MTKQGFKTKFLKVFAVLTVVFYVFFLTSSNNFEGGAIVGQFLYSAVYTFIPSIIIALVWEFFK